MCSLWLVIVLVVYNISTKWNMICRVNVHCSPEWDCCWQRLTFWQQGDIIFMDIVKTSVPVNNPTKYSTNRYDHIPLTYMTILLEDNIWCQEIFLLFDSGMVVETTQFSMTSAKIQMQKNRSTNKVWPQFYIIQVC